MRRFLKKIDSEKLMLFGYTPTLAARKDMVECDANGRTVISLENIHKADEISIIRAFELGMSFNMAGEKTLKLWLDENMVEVNIAGLAIQALVIEKWQKHYGGEPMPEGCLFVTSIIPSSDDEE